MSHAQRTTVLNRTIRRGILAFIPIRVMYREIPISRVFMSSPGSGVAAPLAAANNRSAFNFGEALYVSCGSNREGPAVAQHGRSTSNNGSAYGQAGTAGECQGTKSLRSSPLRGARGERPVAS